jgi:tetrathionate reductase subunit B
MITRRKFLDLVVRCGLVVGGPLAAFEFVDVRKLLAAEANKGPRWAFLIDVSDCCGCGVCIKACRVENETPYESSVTNTWVERYVVLKDGTVLADSPHTWDGFSSTKIELGAGRKPRDVKKEEIDKAYFVPKLCNHCEKPSCVQVCPVGATYKTDDGVVLVDSSWCIGCGYCIPACPYGARYMNPASHTVSKCTFCYHRITQGLKPVCVEMCVLGSRRFANLNDLEDPVTQRILSEPVAVLKEELGNRPRVFYLNLGKEVR